MILNLIKLMLHWKDLKDVLGEDNSEYKKMAGCISDAKFIEEC